MVIEMSSSIDIIRRSIKDALNKHMYGTAIILAEELTRSKKCSVSDVVMHANCYYHNNEYRRCLNILEQSGVLGAEYLSNITEFIHNVTATDTTDCITNIEILNKIQAIHLSAKCLYNLKEYEDCVGLLETVLLSVSYAAVHNIHTSVEYTSMIVNCKRLNESTPYDLNPLADMFFISGLCYDFLENRKRATNQFVTSLHIDIGCMEAAEYMINHGLLNSNEKETIYMVSFGNSTSDDVCMPVGFEHLPIFGHDKYRRYTNTFYRMLFGGIDNVLKERFANGGMDEDGEGDMKDGNIDLEECTMTEAEQKQIQGLIDSPIGSNKLLKQPTSALWLIKQAEYHYEVLHNAVEAYRLSRVAYKMDPYCELGLLVYIASMVELNMKTELFYLSHELVQGTPKSCVTWYSVACYYWVCGKNDVAQKHLEKCIRLDKRFSKAYMLLGHVFSALQESEHAVSMFRTVSRLLPCDYWPMLYMAKEFVKTSNYAMALHILLAALEMCSNNVVILNELGVVLMCLGRHEEALPYFNNGSKLISIARGLIPQQVMDGEQCDTSVFCHNSIAALGSGHEYYGIELFSNYATCLRKLGYVEESLIWYNRCLMMDAENVTIHGNIAYTLHLLRRFDEAIEAYHRTLAMQPDFAFCQEMLTYCLQDSMQYVDAGASVDWVSTLTGRMHNRQVSNPADNPHPHVNTSNPSFPNTSLSQSEINLNFNASQLSEESQMNESQVLGRLSTSSLYSDD